MICQTASTNEGKGKKHNGNDRWLNENDTVEFRLQGLQHQKKTKQVSEGTGKFGTKARSEVKGSRQALVKQFLWSSAYNDC